MYTCFICQKEVVVDLADSLVGIQEDGTVVDMHVACGDERGLDVCGDCQKIVPKTSILDKTYHICKDCKERNA